MIRRTFSSTLLLSIATLLFTSSLPAPGQTKSVRSELHHDLSPAVRDLPTVTKDQPVEQEAAPLRLHPLPAGLKRQQDPDRALQPAAVSGSAATANAALAPSVSLGFDGIGQGVFGFTVSSVPPDTNGAVGLTQYVQWVNASFAVFNKSTGSLIKGPVAGNSLWQGFGGSCETNNLGAPIVLYDKLANRWVFTQGTGASSSFLICVAVSTTSDATGTYNRYAFPYANVGRDSRLGVWPDAYYETSNMFSGTNFVGAEACAYDRNAMLNGQPATQICFPQGTSVSSLLPSDVDGITPPPVGSPNFMVSLGSSALNLFKFHVDFVTPANSTFIGPTVIPVAPFTPLCNGGSGCVPQSGTTTQLDSLADRLMYRLAYRNFGNHESLVVNHSVAAGSSSGIRWYEIQSPNGTPIIQAPILGQSSSAAGPFIAQQGTFAPDANFRWLGSIAMDRTGDIAVGYNVSSSTLFPSIAYAGRTPADQLGTLEPEITIINGGGSQTNGITRWGEYSAMQVDPMDDCTFWYTAEYLKSSGTFNWNTRIASFRFPNCGGSALTSWVQSDGPHFVFQDQNQHLRQIFKEVSLNVWNTEDLTNTTGAPPASTQSALTSWTQSDGPHFVYQDQNQHFRQLFFANNTAWHTQDLTATSGAPPSAPGTTVTSWLQSDGPHFVYLDANQHLRQIFNEVSLGVWNTEDLTNTTGAPPASANSALTAWVQSDGSPHFVYEDANKHLRQLFFSNNAAWHTQDITAVTAALLATPGSALTSWVQSDGPHFVYEDANQHLNQMFFLLSNNTWNTQDLTATTGAPSAEFGSALTSWVQSDGPHFVFQDGNQHLNQMFFLFSNNTWNTQDLTATTGAPVATPGSSLTSWQQADGPHFVFQDGSQHMRQMFFLLGNSTWNTQDLTATSGAPPAE
ncbi:MAG TPA: hypothetical protein VFK06_09410 [Candidatus Angelobacter sp.]|nr:hypothetical protein [Candidatus Angelobacter sp.]